MRVGGWGGQPGVHVLVGDSDPQPPPPVYVSSSTSPILGKIPATVSKHGFTRKAPRILPPAAADGGGVALLPKHLFHQPSYLSFDTGAPLPCLRWVSQVLLQLQTHLNLNCITQVYDFPGVVVCGEQPLPWEERVGAAPPKPARLMIVLS